MKLGKAKVDLFVIQSLERKNYANQQMKYPRTLSQDQDVKTEGKLYFNKV